MEHLKGGHEGNAFGQRVDEGQPFCFRGFAPVIGPEHDIRIGPVGIDDLLQHFQPLGIIVTGVPSGGGFAGGQAVDGVFVVFQGRNMGILTGEFHGFAHQNHTLEAGAVFEELAVGTVVVGKGPGILRVHVALHFAVSVHIQAVFCRLADGVVEIQVAHLGQIHVLDEQQNGIHACVGDGGQMLFGINFLAVAGVGHPGREGRGKMGLSLGQVGSPDPVHPVFQLIAALGAATLIEAHHGDPVFLHGDFIRSGDGLVGPLGTQLLGGGHQNGFGRNLGKLCDRAQGNGTFHGGEEIILQILGGGDEHLTGVFEDHDGKVFYCRLAGLRLVIWIAKIGAVPLEHFLAKIIICLHKAASLFTTERI